MPSSRAAKACCSKRCTTTDEIKKPDSFFSEIPAKSADDDLLEVAAALIEKKTDKFDPKIFKDHYQAALRELIQRKLKSEGPQDRSRGRAKTASRPATSST